MQVLAVDTSNDAPGLDASRKYSPLQGSDWVSLPNAARFQRRARPPYYAGSRLPPQQDDVVSVAVLHTGEDTFKLDSRILAADGMN
ncbi:hypothetical protein B0H17DRAFT_1338435 [Mycena rosella]|uniref:Uncharacterized protein n=1 Tax=Mycena rosella TaxID=1033263 RepID=A0AAD7CMF4_MYCRO|nr:hypothetical protein B0H17DRAFT_1338435 [Mycena rosella]